MSPFDITTTRGGGSALDAKAAAIARAKAAALAAKPTSEQQALVRYIPAAQCPDRNRIVFDDSSSMGRYVEDAKKGVVEYLRNCIPNQTAVAVHFMNSGELALQSELIALAHAVQGHLLNMGGTPFFNTLKLALEATPQATRIVAFTDGSPTDRLNSDKEDELDDFRPDSRADHWIESADIIIKIAKARGAALKAESCIPIDTVFFGSAHNKREIALLKYLSEQTGGYFLHFDPAKPNIFKQLKYLAPTMRLMLTSPAFRAQIERGEGA